MLYSYQLYVRNYTARLTVIRPLETKRKWFCGHLEDSQLDPKKNFKRWKIRWFGHLEMEPSNAIGAIETSRWDIRSGYRKPPKPEPRDEVPAYGQSRCQYANSVIFLGTQMGFAHFSVWTFWDEWDGFYKHIWGLGLWVDVSPRLPVNVEDELNSHP